MDFKAYWARIKTFGITAALAGVLTMSLAACGGDANTGNTGNTGNNGANPTATTGNTAPNTTEGKTNSVDVELNEWNVLPKDLKLPAGSTRFSAKNTGEFPHNFVLQKDGSDVGSTPVFGPTDSPKEVTVDLQPGTYKTLCTVPGHADRGMVGTLTVGD